MASGSKTAFRAALVQMRAGRDVGRNVTDAVSLIKEAASKGAVYIQTPECTTLMELDQPRLMAETKPEQSNPSLQAFTDAARKQKIWLHIGSMAVKVAEGRLANRSYLIAPDGNVAARYDKIHMFDVDLGGGEIYSESANYQAGPSAMLADLPWGRLGLTICYDLRFPALHRALAKAGAKFIAGPAAFTRTTGEAHWHTLLQARAIETGTFVLAAGQGGLHENGRETFGHSLIISPWGEILAEAGVDPQVITADIDAAYADQIRRKIPSLMHDRDFDVVVATPSKSPHLVHEQ
ncbi:MULTISPECIES: carbon-nitrogen hydrolase family protein [unclassified Hyphomicrobium]|uniref:carbon-nitrogen hydrolase family protein n=1 Tax=unclassified Hyphomicrobium TaxID=2619925 RepID=UPI000213E002|nr:MULTISPECIES: carbon-nitrogen hydrolase family protein [unclassified Hyphomicrobium]CCB67643.1 Nitrilase/cyanide hydratase and apolipoprotein N-acyltransferase [Hyphomicrobium sp. MC1]